MADSSLEALLDDLLSSDEEEAEDESPLEAWT